MWAQFLQILQGLVMAAGPALSAPPSLPFSLLIALAVSLPLALCLVLRVALLGVLVALIDRELGLAIAGPGLLVLAVGRDAAAGQGERPL